MRGWEDLKFASEDSKCSTRKFVYDVLSIKGEFAQMTGLTEFVLYDFCLNWGRYSKKRTGKCYLNHDQPRKCNIELY